MKSHKAGHFESKEYKIHSKHFYTPAISQEPSTWGTLNKYNVSQINAKITNKIKVCPELKMILSLDNFWNV